MNNDDREQRSMELEGKVALVTGAASGLGKAIVECFVREGACVVIADVDADATSNKAREIGGIGRAIGGARNVLTGQSLNVSQGGYMQ